VSAYAPYAIFFGVAATAGLLFFSLWERLSARWKLRAQNFGSVVDRAGMRMRADEIVLGVAGSGAAVWILACVILRPNFALGAAMLPLCVTLAAMGFHFMTQRKVRTRMDLFTEQLELALRLIGSGVRVGLGLRQALAMVIDQMPDPSKHEYMRVVGRANLGTSVYDALDEMADRMPSGETRMMARAIRIQSQTGGDLGRILDHLADTIKDRRRIRRKISALTAEGRASAWILSALPVLLAVFIITTQHTMGHALLFTTIGHVSLGIMAVQETLGVFFLLRILKLDV
jgi:tight adherence protein B